MRSSETISQGEQRAVKHIVATMFSAQDALRDLAPEQRWAGMGNLLGDYGEYIALSNYNLKKSPPGADGYDVFTSDGLKFRSKRTIHPNHRLPGEADLLLVLKIEGNVECREPSTDYCHAEPGGSGCFAGGGSLPNALK